MESALNAVVFVVGLVFLNLREMLRAKEVGGSVSIAKEMKDLSDDSSRFLPVFGIYKLNGFSMSSSRACYLLFTLERGLYML